jgi:hypothetical protein
MIFATLALEILIILRLREVFETGILKSWYQLQLKS